MSPTIIPLSLVALLTTIVSAVGQEAVSSITQSRSFPAAPTTAPVSYNEDGDALPGGEATDAGDESFGTQIILKKQEKPRPFTFFADASVFYTNNVDLVPHDTRSDLFTIANVGGAWRGLIAANLIGDITTTASVFRYDRASDLNFERFSGGGGLTWVVPRARGVIGFTHYDFNEVIDAGGKELLQDHTFTLGAQKTFNFGRSHFLTGGASGSLGVSNPQTQERDQGIVFVAYHLQVTRSFGTDVLYRYAAQFYTEGSRIDHNQTLSLAMGWSPTGWIRVSGLLSGIKNDSNRGAFEYQAVNVGAGVRCEVKF